MSSRWRCCLRVLAGGPVPLLLAAPLAAQSAPVHVSHFTVADGLAQNYVTALTQDSIGYLWVGTSRGVQRFDGYGFTSLAALRADSPRALDGPIADLLIDARGRLWVASDSGLFSGFAGREPLRRQPGGTAVAPDSGGRLWFVERADRLGWLDWNSATPRLTTLPIDTLPRCCTHIATSRDQQVVWVVPTMPQPGVIRIDGGSGAWRSYRLPGITEVAGLLEDAGGRIWVAGHGGVAALDPGAHEFRALEEFRGLEAGDVRHDGRGGLLVPTERWLARLDPSGRIVQRWAPTATYGAGPLLTAALFIDREDGIWIGTLAAGLVRIDRTPPAFGHVTFARDAPGATSDFVMALHEARDGTLYVGTLGSGAFALATNGTSPERWRASVRRTVLSTGNVWDVAEDDRGDVWFAHSEGLCSQRGRCLRPHATSRFADFTRAADGWLWFARGHAGAGSFHPATWREGPPVPSAWTIVAFADSVSGWLWLGGDRLSRARMADGRLLGPLEIVPAEVRPGEPIFDIRRDSRGIVWLASHRGLQRWNAMTRRFAPVDVAELRGTTVFSLAEDLAGRLWLGTSHGLVQYSPVSGLARRYRAQDGVLSGEFNRRAALRLRDGTMVFGGLHGLTVFRPEQVNAPRPSAPLVFTRWVKATRNGTVDGQVSGDREGAAVALELGPGDRAVTLEFAALTFAGGPARRYRHRLGGLSPEWTETSDRAVTYGTLPPGDYVFEVQASAGAEGAWSEPGATLRLHVVPPFWATTWFRALAVALALIALWLLHRLRLRQALATERLRVRISRDLHDEIGAGLSSIALLSDAVGMTGPGERRQLERIGLSARAMVADLRDIVWALDPEGDRVRDVVARMQDVATDLLRDTRVSFHAPPDELSGRLGMATRRDLLRIYKESLHNVARHARAGAVDIRLSSCGDDLELVVTDDGVGFDPDVIDEGIGLKSMRERAARLGGRLELTSRTPGGTRVRLTVKRT